MAPPWPSLIKHTTCNRDNDTSSMLEVHFLWKCSTCIPTNLLKPFPSCFVVISHHRRRPPELPTFCGVVREVVGGKKGGRKMAAGRLAVREPSNESSPWDPTTPFNQLAILHFFVCVGILYRLLSVVGRNKHRHRVFNWLTSWVLISSTLIWTFHCVPLSAQADMIVAERSSVT